MSKQRTSENRLKLEEAMSANPNRVWTTKTVREEICNVPHAANYLARLLEAGQIRIIGKNSSGHNEFVWHTSTLRSRAEKGSDIAGSRVYVNGAMPNGDADYWRKAMAWGR